MGGKIEEFLDYKIVCIVFYFYTFYFPFQKNFKTYLQAKGEPIQMNPFFFNES